jgi:hypothetical protein
LSERRRTGRPPTAYTEERAAEILRRIAEGESLRTICQDVGVARQTVHGWVLDDHEGFGVRYARAKQLMFMDWAEELDEIAADREKDFKQNEEGKWVPDYEVIARSKLRIDTRKWVLAKQMPASWGDKLEVTGKDGGQLAAPTTTINVLALAPEQREQLKQILLAATKGKSEDEQ